MAGITYSIGLDASSFLNGMNRVMGSAGRAKDAVMAAGSGMAQGLGKVGDILFKLPDQMRALSGIIGGLSLPSKLAGSAETTSVAFRVLIGDAGKAEEVLGRIRNLAASTPFEFPELADAARKLAAFGENADDIPEVLRRVGDVASATGSNVSELAELYGKARVQGTMFAEDINQLTGRGIPIIQEFAKQLGVTQDQIKKLAADGKINFPMLEEAFRNLTGEGGKFSGMMAEISATFEGKLSTLQGSFGTLLTKLGEGVNEGLKPVFDELTAQLDAQQGMAQGIGEAIGKGIEVGLAVIKSGQIGNVLSSQLKAAALEFSSVLAQGLEMVVENTPLYDNNRLTRVNRDGSIVPSTDEPGIDELNQAARDAREDANKQLAEPIRMVDENRAARAEAQQAKDNEQAAAKAQREEDAAIEKDAADYVAGLDAEMAAEKAADADAKAYVDSLTRKPAPAAAALPVGGPVAAVPPGIGEAAANAAATATGMEGLAEPARRTIKGARFAKGAASGLGRGNAYRGAPDAGDLDRQTGRGDQRASRRAKEDGDTNKGNEAGQRENQRDAIFRKLLDAVNRIEKKVTTPDPQPVSSS